MNDSALLQQHVASFVMPQTARPLGGAGASFEVSRRPAGWHVAIRCGFPLARSRRGLIDALRVHCASLPGVGPIEFEVTSVIVAHAVQHGLKPLPGVHNLVAVASGKGGVGKSTVP
jgi:ATP-binding protein involved in chromosome partitioning